MSDRPELFIYRPFAGRERKFMLTLGGVEALEQRCNAGILAIMLRLAGHQASVHDVRETLRQGLIGGGMPAVSADQILMADFDAQPLVTYLGIACDVIAAFVNGVPVKKSDDSDQDPPKTGNQETSAAGSRPAVPLGSVPATYAF